MKQMPAIDAPTQNSRAKDVMASDVVFLVALPICMVIAIASGAPPSISRAGLTGR